MRLLNSFLLKFITGYNSNSRDANLLTQKNQTEFPKKSDFQEKNQIFTKTQTITSIAKQDCSITTDSAKYPPTLTHCSMLWAFASKGIAGFTFT